MEYFQAKLLHYTIEFSSKPIPHPLTRHFSRTIHLEENFHPPLPHLPAEKHTIPRPNQELPEHPSVQSSCI